MATEVFGKYEVGCPVDGLPSGNSLAVSDNAYCEYFKDRCLIPSRPESVCIWALLSEYRRKKNKLDHAADFREKYNSRASVIVSALDLIPDRPDYGIDQRQAVFDDTKDMLEYQLGISSAEVMRVAESRLDMSKIGATLGLYESILKGRDYDESTMKDSHEGVVDLLLNYRRSILDGLNNRQRKRNRSTIKQNLFSVSDQSEACIYALISRLQNPGLFPQFSFGREESNSSGRNRDYLCHNHDLAIRSQDSFIPIQIKFMPTGRKYSRGVVKINFSETFDAGEGLDFNDSIKFAKHRPINLIANMLGAELEGSASDLELERLDQMSNHIIDSISEQSL